MCVIAAGLEPLNDIMRFRSKQAGLDVYADELRPLSKYLCHFLRPRHRPLLKTLVFFRGHEKALNVDSEDVFFSRGGLCEGNDKAAAY